MKISFDIDGVLADFTSAAVLGIREMYRPDLPEAYTQVTWNFDDVLKPGQWDKVFEHLMAQPSFWADLPAFEDNVNALATLKHDIGEENIYMITSRPPCSGGSLEQMTKLWLFQHDLPMLNVHIVERAAQKAAIIQREGITWSLDDYWPTIEQCCAVDGHNPRLLDRIYNWHAIHLPRVYSVAEFLTEVSLG